MVQNFVVQMSTIDSEAVFDARMQVVGLAALDQTRIRALGWTTHSTFAYSSSFTPGQQDEAPFIAAVVVPVLGDAGHVNAAKLRRLLFESYTLSVQDLRSQLERTADDPPRKISSTRAGSKVPQVVSQAWYGYPPQ